MSEVGNRGVVVPGDVMGTIEEGGPGEGTYEKEGRVRATLIGQGQLDRENKVFVVKPLAPGLSLPREGEEVIARVVSVQNSLAILEIVKSSDRTLGGTFTGLLHHTRAGGGVRSKLKKYMKAGDIVRAKVVYAKNLIHVSTVGSRLGVILGYCSKCGGKLERKGSGNYLHCVNCDWKEARFTAADYGTLEW